MLLMTVILDGTTPSTLWFVQQHVSGYPKPEQASKVKQYAAFKKFPARAAPAAAGRKTHCELPEQSWGLEIAERQLFRQ